MTGCKSRSMSGTLPAPASRLTSRFMLPFCKRSVISSPRGKISKSPRPMSIAEIAAIAGAQFVVPLDNARYALNAANARWGSLYDALYGTNVIAEEDGAEKGEHYNPRRGAKVIAYTEKFLDKIVALKRGSFADVSRFFLKRAGRKKQLAATLKDGKTVGLADGRQFLGYRESDGELTDIALGNNGARIEIRNRPQPSHRQNPPGGRERCGPRGGHHHHRRLRGCGRGGGRRRQGCGLSHIGAAS